MLKTKPSDLHLYKWGGIACFLLAVCFYCPIIYLPDRQPAGCYGSVRLIPWLIFFTVLSGLPAL